MFTFKMPKAKTPLMFHNGVISNNGTTVFEAESINEIARQLIKGEISFESGDVNNKAVVSRLNFNEVMNKRHIDSITKNQDLESAYKLVAFADGQYSLFVRGGRPARMYFKNKDRCPALSDDNADNFGVIQIPKEIAEYVSLGDVIIGCCDKTARIFTGEHYTIVDRADEYELNENLNKIDTEKFMYFIVE